MGLEYYQTLGISRNASAKEVKLAYRKAAMRHHPDRGGDEEEFIKVQRAYAVLMDPKLRHQYDLSGETLDVFESEVQHADEAFQSYKAKQQEWERKMRKMADSSGKLRREDVPFNFDEWERAHGFAGQESVHMDYKEFYIRQARMRDAASDAPSSKHQQFFARRNTRRKFSTFARLTRLMKFR